MSQENLVQFEDYVGAAKRQRRLIAGVVGVCVLLAIAATFAMAKTYTAESRVLVRPVLDPSDQTSAEVNIDTERGVARSLSVSEIAAALLGSDQSASALQQDLSVSAIPDSQILKLSYRAGEAERSAEVANAYADAYLQFRTQEADSAKEQVQTALEAERANLVARRDALIQEKRDLPEDSPDRVAIDSELDVIEANDAAIRADLANLGSAPVDAGTVLDQAEVPSGPSSPSLKLNLAAGLLVGTVLGLLLAFLRERHDLGAGGPETAPTAGQDAASPAPAPMAGVTRPPSTPGVAAPASGTGDRRSSTPVEQVLAASSVPALGLVPRLTNDADAPPFDSVTMLNGHVGDRLRELDAALDHHLRRSGQRIIVVTTPERRGLTVGLAGSLAVTAAQGGREVLLIGADLEQPTLHSRFQLANDQGLAEALRGQRPLAQVMQGWGGLETLVIVTAGQVQPGDGPLDENVLRSRLSSLREDFPLVLVEAPPVLASPDALTLATVSDGAILAVDPRGSDPDRIALAARELQQRTDVIGSIVVEARSRRESRTEPRPHGSVSSLTAT